MACDQEAALSNMVVEVRVPRHCFIELAVRIAEWMVPGSRRGGKLRKAPAGLSEPADTSAVSRDKTRKARCEDFGSRGGGNISCEPRHSVCSFFETAAVSFARKNASWLVIKMDFTCYTHHSAQPAKTVRTVHET